MTEDGAFRTSFSGFNKADVLAYIDALQSRHSEELQEAVRQAEQIKSALSAQEKFIEELRQENETLREKAEVNHRLEADCRRLSEEAEIFQMEKAELNARLAELQQRLTSDDERQTLRLREERDVLSEQVAQLESQRTELHAVAEQRDEELRRLTEQRDALAESNRRYDALVGDVGSFIMELHSMGQRFLETAYKRSDACLSAVEGSVSSLSEQLADARSRVDGARQELLDHGTIAGLRLDELVQKLEESAGTVREDGSAKE